MRNVKYIRILPIVLIFFVAGCSFKNKEDEKPKTVAVAVNPEDLTKSEKIFKAIFDSDPSELKKILKDATFEEVNFRNSADETALELAVEGGRITAVEALLNAGAIPLQYTSQSSNESPQTMIDLARSKVEVGGNKRILAALTEVAESQKKSFETLVEKLDFKRAWEYAVKYNIVALGADADLLKSIAAKAKKLGVLSGDDRTVVVAITNSINSREAWNNVKLTPIFQLSITAHDVELLVAINRVKKVIELNLADMVYDDDAINISQLEKSLAVLEQRNIKTSIKKISESLNKRLRNILATRNYSAWSEFSWIIKNLSEPQTTGPDIVIRDNYVNYLVNYYYVNSKSMGASFPIDDFIMYLEYGKKLSTELGISFDEMELVLSKDSRYPSFADKVSSAIAKNVNYFSKESWKKALTDRDLSEHPFYLANFSFSSLNLSEAVDIVDNLSVEKNMFNLVGKLIDKNFNDLKFSPQEAFDQLDKSIKDSIKGRPHSEMIFNLILSATRNNGIKISTENVNILRNAVLFVQYFTLSDAQKYCSLNEIDVSGEQATLPIHFNTNTYVISLSQYFGLKWSNRDLRDKLLSCVSKVPSEVFLNVDHLSYSLQTIGTAKVFKIDNIINENTWKFIEHILPHQLEGNYGELLLTTGLDITILKNKLKEITKKNDSSSLLNFLIKLNKFTGLNYNLDPYNSLLEALSESIKNLENEFPVETPAVLKQIHRYLEITNLRFAISIHSSLIDSYRDYLMRFEKSDDPIIKIKENINEKQKILEDLIKFAGLNIQLDLLNPQVIGAVNNFDKEKENTISKLLPDKPNSNPIGLEKSLIDKATFDVLRALNARIGKTNSWVNYINTTFPKLIELIDMKDTTNFNFEFGTIEERVPLREN